MTDEQRAELRRRCEAANLGHLLANGTAVLLEGKAQPLLIIAAHGTSVAQDEALAAFISAADPPTVLALLDERDEARREVERLEEWKRDIEESHRRIVAGDCAPDEKHCSCVPALRSELDEAKKALRR